MVRGQSFVWLEPLAAELGARIAPAVDDRYGGKFLPQSFPRGIGGVQTVLVGLQCHAVGRLARDERLLEFIKREATEVLIECLCEHFVATLDTCALKQMVACLRERFRFARFGRCRRSATTSRIDQCVERLRALRRKILALPPANLGGGDFGEFATARLRRDAVDLARRRLAAVFFPEDGDFRFNLGAAFRRCSAVLGTHASDFKSFDDTAVAARRFDFVSGREHAACEFVLIDFTRVADGLDHLAFGEREPFVGFGIEGRVGRDEVGVELRVERPRGVVLEARSTEVAGDRRLLRPRGVAATHPPRGESLEFGKGNTDGITMCLAQSLVAKRHGQQ